MLSPLLLSLALLGDSGEAHLDYLIINATVGESDPTVDLVEALSDADKTVIDVQIPGFYTQEVENEAGYKLNRVFVKSWSTSGDADDAPFQLDATTEFLGAPELPVLRLSLVVPPGCDFARLDTANSSISDAKRYSLGDLMLEPNNPDPLPIYPVHEPAWDGDPDLGTPNGTPEKFAGFLQDYGPTGCFPETHFDDLVDAQSGLAGLNNVELEIRLFRWNEASKQL